MMVAFGGYAARQSMIEYGGADGRGLTAVARNFPFSLGGRVYYIMLVIRFINSKYNNDRI